MNVWKEAFEHPFCYIWFSIAAAAFLAVGIFAAVRLIQFIMEKGCSRSIAIIALSLDIVAATLATIYWAVDPWGALFFPQKSNG